MTPYEIIRAQALNGYTFSEEEMTNVLTLMTAPDADSNATKDILTHIARRGETALELVATARFLRDKSIKIDAPADAVDCCGTGGDGMDTYNISTAVALVAVSCGVPVAKHGNRASSSRSGGADVLEALGVNLNLPIPVQERSLRELGFCFLMAPNHHPAMKSLGPLRRELGIRTIFNLVGPLINPANTKRQMIGVSSLKALSPMADALKLLGSEKALVVHGADGLDEITLTTHTFVASLENDTILPDDFYPDYFGLAPVTPEEIKGGDVRQNAAALLDILNGAKNGYRRIVQANAAAVLRLHRDVPLRDGAAMAGEALDSGLALSVLNKYKEFG